MAIYAGSAPQSLAGKSAYQQAVDAGYKGTEAEFNELLFNLPKYGDLGSAALLNVPASGNAASGEIVLGSDTRLTDSRTAKNIHNTYNAQSTDPISGKGVSSALSTLGTAATKNVTNSYNAASTDPISGQGVAAALAGFSGGTDIQISQTKPSGQSEGGLWFKVL